MSGARIGHQVLHGWHPTFPSWFASQARQEIEPYKWKAGVATGGGISMTILRCGNRLTAIALLLGSYAISGAQSHDPKNPTPLGPGVNKGNVDNKQGGPNYYYFFAGPGPINLDYAFKEMGVFGNPLRQSL